MASIPNYHPSIPSDPTNENVDTSFLPSKHLAPSQPKRALGDITNFTSNHHSQNIPQNHPQHPFKSNPAKIRRTTTTKIASSNSAAARRAKNAALVAATKKAASPMSTSTAPRRMSGRLAKRAAAAAAAAHPCNLQFSSPTPNPHSSAQLPTNPSSLDFQLPHNVIDIDVCDIHNPLAVSQYANNIHANFVYRETLFMPDPQYMSRQSDINIKMRSILIDWLVDVHQKFKLRPDTLHLTVNIIDRFLACQPVMRRKLQLVGVTAMLIASKYEEIYAPEVSDFVFISDKAYSKEEILSMEAHILNKLNFDVTVPSALTFMHRCLKAARVVVGTSAELHKYLTHYLVELALQDSAMLVFRPSVRAAAACSLSAKLCNVALLWNSTMTFHCGGWTAKELEECEADMCRLLEHEHDRAGTNKLTAVKRKFSSHQYASVSTSIPDLCSSANATHPMSMDICSTE